MPFLYVASTSINRPPLSIFDEAWQMSRIWYTADVPIVVPKALSVLFFVHMEELRQLEATRERYITRIFKFGFEFALVIAVPAVAALLLGKKYFPEGNTIFLLLGLAALLSWTVIIVRWRRINRTMMDLDQRIRTKRAELGVQSRPEHSYPDEDEANDDITS